MYINTEGATKNFPGAVKPRIWCEMLNFQRDVLTELHSEDALSIIGKGLGLNTIVEQFIALYQDSRCFVLVLNCTATQEDRLQSRGIKIVNNSTSTNERLGLYLSGGVFVVTSRILVVDLLMSRIPAHLITGILVLNAHNIGEYSNEAFIIKLFRQKNCEGFIKAVSDCPERFTGLSVVERYLKTLHLKNIHLWPRFHLSVKNDLSTSESSDNENPFELIEFQQPLTLSMQKIQLCLVEILKAVLNEFKSQQNMVDPDLISVENCLKKSFFKIISSRYCSNVKVKQLVSDIRVVKRLLLALLQMDCVSFLNFLHNIVSSECITKNAQGNIMSSWLFMPEADMLFKYSQERVFTTNDSGIHLVLERSPKLNLFLDILREIYEHTRAVEADDVSTLLIFAEDKKILCTLLHSFIDELQKNANDSLQHAFLSNLWEKYQKSNYKISLLLNKIVSNRSSNTDGTYSHKQYHSHVKRQRRNRGGFSAVNENSTRDPTSNINGGIVELTHFFRIPNDGNRNTLSDTTSNITADLSSSESCEPLMFGKRCRVVFCSESEFNMVDSLEPTFFILYDPTPKVVRQIEVYHARRKCLPLRVYFCMYEGSVQEQMYLESIKSENEAFESLIKSKSELTIHDFSSNVESNARSSSINSLIALNSSDWIPIIVDMREFRAQLPYVLHLNNFRVIPQTIEVGDYLLTSKVVVERKSLTDLTDSLNSGRLLEQVKMMCSTYETAILMIETNRAIAKEDMNRLILLCLHFPSLRLMWAFSPQHSAEMFKDLGAVGAHSLPTVRPSTDLNTYENQGPCEFLQKVPGASKTDQHKYRNLKELIEAANSLSDSEPANSLFNFVRHHF